MFQSWLKQIANLLGAIADSQTQTVTVTNVATVLASGIGPGVYRLCITNTGNTALNSFSIQGRCSATDSWLTVANQTSEFATIPDGIAGFLLMSKTTTNPTTLGAGAKWSCSIDTKTFAEVQVLATVASGSTTVLVEVN